MTIENWLLGDSPFGLDESTGMYMWYSVEYDVIIWLEQNSEDLTWLLCTDDFSENENFPKTSFWSKLETAEDVLAMLAGNGFELSLTI